MNDRDVNHRYVNDRRMKNLSKEPQP